MQWVWKEFGEATEAILKNCSASQEGETGTIQTTYSKDGMLLNSNEEVIRWSKEHFKELLNPTNPPSMVEVEDHG